jgi:hypothetical protein
MTVTGLDPLVVTHHRLLDLHRVLPVYRTSLHSFYRCDSDVTLLLHFLCCTVVLLKEGAVAAVSSSESWVCLSVLSAPFVPACELGMLQRARLVCYSVLQFVLVQLTLWVCLCILE